MAITKQRKTRKHRKNNKRKVHKSRAQKTKSMPDSMVSLTPVNPVTGRARKRREDNKASQESAQGDIGSELSENPTIKMGLEDCQDVTSLASFLRRVSNVVKRKSNVWYWENFTEADWEPVAWITNRGRFLGVGAQTWLPDAKMNADEYMLAVSFPFNGFGYHLAKEIVSADIIIKGHKGNREVFLELDDNNRLMRTIRCVHPDTARPTRMCS